MSELKRLLCEIRDRRPDISIRFRMIAEMWGKTFMQVVTVKERGAFLKEENSDKFVSILDLSNVMQFELDHSFNGYQAYYHYEVKPNPAFDSPAEPPRKHDSTFLY